MHIRLIVDYFGTRNNYLINFEANDVLLDALILLKQKTGTFSWLSTYQFHIHKAKKNFACIQIINNEMCWCSQRANMFLTWFICIIPLHLSCPLYCLIERGVMPVNVALNSLFWLYIFCFVSISIVHFNIEHIYISMCMRLWSIIVYNAATGNWLHVC